MRDIFQIKGRRDLESGKFILEVGFGWGVVYGLILGVCIVALAVL